GGAAVWGTVCARAGATKHTGPYSRWAPQGAAPPAHPAKANKSHPVSYAWRGPAKARLRIGGMHFRPPLLPADPQAPFPPAETALREPDGLLAIGGDLSPVRLLNAYRHGIFPWYSQGQPILWWSPDPRMVFRTDGVRLASRFRRTLRRSGWQLRADTAFAEVVDACAA